MEGSRQRVFASPGPWVCWPLFSETSRTGFALVLPQPKKPTDSTLSCRRAAGNGLAVPPRQEPAPALRQGCQWLSVTYGA